MFGDPTAPRFLNDKLCAELRQVGVKQPRLDKCVQYTLEAAGKLHCVLGVHVDGLIGAMKADYGMVNICERLASRLKFGSWKEA